MRQNNFIESFLNRKTKKVQKNHPWKQALSAKKAAQDKLDQKAIQPRCV